MPHFFYTVLYYCLTPLFFLRLLIKHQKSRAYKEQRQDLRLSERLGFFKKPQWSYDPIWLHTVSVGELIATLPLIKKIRHTAPLCPLVITCTTTTGSAQIVKLFAEEIAQGQIFHVYLPYDLPGAMQRFLKAIHPRLGIIMETEIWPNLLNKTQQLKIPMWLLNARLSERSARGYQRVQALIQAALQQFTGIAAQDHLDAQRLLALGANKTSLSITGSIKFDIQLNHKDIIAGKQLRKQLHWQDKTVLIAASTHKGEDEILLAVYKQLKVQHPSLCLIIVPRHPERFQSVYQLLQAESSFNVLKRSQINTVHSLTDILLGDSMGEMIRYFSCADIVFMGGTLMPIGGHNILEPAALGLPIIVGHQMFNFNAINTLFLHYHAALQVAHVDELQQVLSDLLSDPKKAEKMAHNAQQLIAKNAGAVDKMMVLLKPYLFIKS